MKKIVNNVKNEYRKIYGKHLVKIVLYGSCARNDFDGESDIDVVGIVRGEKKDIQDKLSKIRKSIYRYDIDNDTVTSAMAIQFDEYEKYKKIIPYYKNIEKEGKIIG